MMFGKGDRKARSMSQAVEEEQCRTILSIPSCQLLQHEASSQ